MTQARGANNNMPESFESRLHDVLLTELRRQGLINGDDIVRTVMANLRRSGITSIHVNVSNLQLADRACVAVIETLLKLASHPSSPPEWVVDLSGNSFTDRVSGHLILLVQRCTKLVSLDISNTENVSAAAVSKIEAACKISANARLELISGPHQRLTRADSLARTPREAADPPSLAETASPTAGTVRAGPRGEAMGENGPVDIAALKRRRDNLLKEEAAAGAKPLVRQASRTPNRGTSPSARQSRQQSAEPRRPSPQTSTRAPSPRVPKSRVPAVASAKVPPQAVASPRTTATSRTSPGTRNSPNPPQKSHPATHHTPVSTSLASQAKPRSASSSAKPTSTTAITAANLKRQPSAAGKARREDDIASVGSDATTATEVPDQQDFLDITANMNPMIDHVVSLEHQGVTPEVLIRRLKQAVVAPPGSYSFASVTVLNLASNQLASLDGSHFPATLLRVDLSDNQLVTIPSFANCSMLAVANLRRNRIQKIGSAFEHNLNIGHLFLGRNEISFVDGIGHLWVLETLDLSCNKISSQVQLRPLSLNSALRHIVLKGNPLEKRVQSYRAILRNLVPSLIAVDNERLAFSRIAEARMSDDHQLSHNAVVGTVGTSAQQPAANGVKGVVGGTVGGYAVRNMLSKGISGMASVYSEKKSIHASSKRIATVEKHKAAPNGKQPLSRREVVTKLCQQSKRFLEETIVERMTAAERRRELEGADGNLRSHQQPFGYFGGDGATLDHESGRTMESPSESLGKDGVAVLGVDSDADYDDGGDAPFGEASQWRSNEPVLRGHKDATRKSSSPAPERPRAASASKNSPDNPQSVFDRLLASSHTLPRAPTPNEKSHPQQGDAPGAGAATAALAYRHTASSKGRSRSNSNASSRSPSPNIGDGTKVLQVDVNTPLGASVKHANTPIRAVAAAAPTLLTKAQNRPSKEPANYITPSRKLGPRRGGGLTSPRMAANDSDEDEIILSPEGASSLFPQDHGGKQVSPIRVNDLEMTDLSADGTHLANAMVPRMDPGGAASPLPRSVRPPTVDTPVARRPPAGNRQGPLVSPRAEEPPRNPMRGADTPPLAKGGPSPGVTAWTRQFQQDLGAVQMSLKTVVDLIWSSLHAADAFTAERLAEERTRCLNIITQSKMLDDTDVPIGVIRFYGFRPDELNDPNVARLTAEADDERGDLLEGIHEMGSSKTCLRYLVALVDTGRDDLLRRYVESIKQEMSF